MSEQDVLLGALVRAFRARITLLITERTACWGLAIAGVAGMVLAILHSFTECYISATETGMALVLGLVALLGALGGALYARRRPVRSGHRADGRTAPESQTAREYGTRAGRECGGVRRTARVDRRGCRVARACRSAADGVSVEIRSAA